MGDWSELPPEIIHMISLRIDNPFDLIHFRSICSWWRSSSIPKFRPIPSLRCPLPSDLLSDEDDCRILRSSVYLIKSFSHDPPRFWLLKLQEEENGVLAPRCFFSRTTCSERGCSYPNMSLDLLNSQVTELAQEHIISYTSWRNSYSCGDDRHIILMLLGAKNKEFMIMRRLPTLGLGIYRSFEERWTDIETTHPFAERTTSFNGELYAITYTGVTKVVKPTLEVNSFHRSRPCDNTRIRWFVESEDKLLLVELCMNNRNDLKWFEISELNEKRNDWIQVDDLGGRVLFLDYDQCFSCLPSQLPGLRPNSIIFWDLSRNVRRFQVFEFGKQGFEYFGNIPEYSQLFPAHG